jgi:hypothetical protein
MTANGVEETRKSKAQDSSNEEEQENQLFREFNVKKTIVAEWFEIEDDCDGNEGNETNQMSPNIASLCMNSKYRFEALPK